MKKVLFGLLLIILILCGVFYKQILATIDFYQYQQEHSTEFAKATINWKQIPFTSTGNSGVAGEALTFDSLQFPIPFTASKKVGADAAFAFGGAKSISITWSSVAADFFDAHEFSDADKKATCAFLSQTSGRGACTSNYDFYRAFLELNETDMHIFSSLEDKNSYNRLMILRADNLPTNTVSGFETKNIRGFLFTIDSGNYIAHVFDSKDQMYEIKFTNLEQSDVVFVLSNNSSK